MAACFAGTTQETITNFLTTQPKVPSTTMAPSVQAILTVSVRSADPRAETSSRRFSNTRTRTTVKNFAGNRSPLYLSERRIWRVGWLESGEGSKTKPKVMGSNWRNSEG